MEDAIMSYIKDVQAYEASQAYFRKEEEEIRELKQGILENADYACNADEYTALKAYLSFVDDKEVLGSLVEYYYELAQERIADLA